MTPFPSSSTVIAPPVTPQQISLKVSDPSAERVVVQSAAISTEVTGRLAVTTFDLVFFNPNNRQLEGTFEFPLLQGQHVVRFALDINGAMREAVPVEKEKGRVVFEEIQRRRVDPGLLEQTAGNNYRARIFPIPARGTRRIIIAYQEDLLANTAANAGPRHRLALNFAEVLANFDFSARVFGAPGAQAARASTTLDLALPNWSNDHSMRVSRKNFVARGVVEFALPVMATAARPTVLTENFNGRAYFYAEAPLPAAALAAKPRPVPKVVGLLWDASGSGRERDHAREFALLDAWFAAVRDVEVRLVCLRNVAAAPVTVRVNDGNWSELRGILERVIYDGGTSFDGLTDDAAVDEWLLFSDGLINFGVTQALTKLPLRAPVHAVNASASASPAFLRGLAAQGSGEFADLLMLDAAGAAARLRQFSPRVISVERDPQAVAQVFPEAGTPVNATSGALVVTGLLRAQSASVRVKVGFSEEDSQVVDIAVKAGEGANTLAARAWAVAKIEHLATAPGGTREDIRRTSVEFGIVTADTSLIVLETYEDYVRYNIEPPASLKDYRTRWDDARRWREESVSKSRNTQIERVQRMFNERVKWWETDFSKVAPKESGRGGESRMSERDRSANSRDVPATAAHADTWAAEDEPPRRHSTFLFSAPPSGMGVMRNLVQRFVSPTLAETSTAAAPHEEQHLTFAAPPAAASAPFPASAALADHAITLQRWSPSAGYLDRLRRAPAAERFTIYIEERADHAREPGFYMDVAGYFFDEAKDAEIALQILSNLAELSLEDAALLRVLGYRLVQAGRTDLALPVFERVLKIRGEEPQSQRDLATVCAKLGQHQRAVDLLWEVVSRRWDDRFPEIELIALEEMNAIIATCGVPLDVTRISTPLQRNLPLGLRVVLTWDTDNCDIDLWVDTPDGERAMYSNRDTHHGGHMSCDFRQGYGPEEFLFRTPKSGKYTARINYFGDSRQSALGPVTAQVRLITDFGTPDEKEKLITVRLAERKESLFVGSIEIK